MPPRTGPLDRADLAHVVAAVRRLEQRVDVVVVLPHWGTQYTHVAEPVQSRVGRRLVDAGADLVVGGHPHWVQGLERYGGAVIAHSLGNFVFDMDFMEQTMEGVTLTATVPRRPAARGRAHALPPRRHLHPAPCHRPGGGGDPPRRADAQHRVGPLISCNQASTSRPVRASWARLTTGGRSAALW